MTEWDHQGADGRLGVRLPDLVEVVRNTGDGGTAFERVVAVAVAAERAGAGSVWVDDLVPHAEGEGPAIDLVFEAYSVLGALAERTRTVDLGALPWAGNARPPSLLAKVVSGLDVISHGRALLSLGIGPTSDATSADRLAEELAVCRVLLTEEAPSFEGAYFRLSEAANQPRPIRSGGVPLVVVLGSPEALVPAARRADAVVVPGDADLVAVVRRQLDDELAVAGREPDDVRLLWLSDVVADGRPDRHSGVERLHQGRRAGADQCLVSVDGRFAGEASDHELAAAVEALRRAVDGESGSR